MAQASSSGILYVLSAPSGTGKSTLARRLLARVSELEFSVSYTTRPKRPGEQDGRDYHFVERDRFESMVEQRAFLEWASVFNQLYGTGEEATRRKLSEGRHLLLDIDVQGARQVRESGIPNVSVMILPPDFRTLESRLTRRGSETPADVAERLAQARRELGDYRYFDYLVVNHDIDRTVLDMESIVRAEQRRTRHGAAQAEAILATFPS